MAEIEKTPVPGGNVNAPESGTYGEKAALGRLRQQLPVVPGTPPPSGGQAGPAVVPLPGPGAGPVAPLGQSPIPGIPSALLAPSARPGAPVGGGLPAPAPGPMAGAVATPAQHRLRVLAALAQSEDPEVREWAEMVQDLLLS